LYLHRAILFFIYLCIQRTIFQGAKVEKRNGNQRKKEEEGTTRGDNQEAISRYLKLEKSLSPNTLDAYLTDLYKLINFLEQEKVGILDVCLSDLQHFAAGLHDIGIHPRSQARILSGIKSFFRFLIMEDYRSRPQ